MNILLIVMGSLFREQASQQMDGVEDREVVLEPDAYNIFVNAHVSLLYSRQSKTFKAINDQYAKAKL